MEALAAGGQHLVRRLARCANEKDPAEALFICAIGLSERVERLLRSVSGARLLAGALSDGRPIADLGMGREGLLAVPFSEAGPCEIRSVQEGSGIGNRARSHHRRCPSARPAVLKHF